MNLGYYYQNTFIYNDNEPEIPIDLYLSCIEFLKYFEKVFIFVNHSTISNRITKKLPTGVELVDLGPLAPHWKRLFGFGFDKKKIDGVVKPY